VRVLGLVITGSSARVQRRAGIVLGAARTLAGWAMAVALALVADPAAAQATIELRLAGRTVAVDVYRPVGPLRGAVILSHGFTRSRTTLGGHAAALAAQGILALTPDLPATFDFRRNAQGLGELVAMLRVGGDLGPPVARVVLVGFSAGGLSSLLAAATPGVVGYVGLDPFDRSLPDGQMALGLAFAPSLKTEALLLRAPPSRCNAESVAAPWSKALPALWTDRVIPGASHCDFESPSDWMCAIACGAPDPARQALVRAALVEAMERWLPPTSRQ
jgi:dienelactone hydrolase